MITYGKSPAESLTARQEMVERMQTLAAAMVLKQVFGIKPAEGAGVDEWFTEAATLLGPVQRDTQDGVGYFGKWPDQPFFDANLDAPSNYSRLPDAYTLFSYTDAWV